MSNREGCSDCPEPIPGIDDVAEAIEQGRELMLPVVDHAEECCPGCRLQLDAAIGIVAAIGEQVAQLRADVDPLVSVTVSLAPAVEQFRQDDGTINVIGLVGALLRG